MNSKVLKVILDAVDVRLDSLQNKNESEKKNSVDKVQKLFIKNINQLTIDDLVKLTTTERNKLIEIIDLDKNDFNFENDGYSKLFDSLKNYIEIINRRISENEKDIDKFECIKNLFTGMNKKHDLFTDINGLRVFIGSLGLNDSEKIMVEKYLSDYNFKARVLDSEVKETVSYIYSEVNDHTEVKDAIKDYFKRNKNILDLNFLKSYAADIGKEINKTPELVENVLIGMIVGSEFKKYMSGDDNSLDHLTRIHRVLNEYTFDDMRSVIAEANRIFNLEMMNLSNGQVYNFEEIVVTNAQSPEEFEELKGKKLAMIAYLLKEKVKDYESNLNFDLKDKYKELIIGLIDEYYNTNGLFYKDVVEKSR